MEVVRGGHDITTITMNTMMWSMGHLHRGPGPRDPKDGTVTAGEAEAGVSTMTER